MGDFHGKRTEDEGVVSVWGEEGESGAQGRKMMMIPGGRKIGDGRISGVSENNHLCR